MRRSHCRFLQYIYNSYDFSNPKVTVEDMISDFFFTAKFPLIFHFHIVGFSFLKKFIYFAQHLNQMVLFLVRGALIYALLQSDEHFFVH